MAITSKEINLSQLSQELGGKGLIANFDDPNNKLIFPADGSTLTEEQLSNAIAAHIAVDETAAKAAEKETLLTKLGITAEEAKLLLS